MVWTVNNNALAPAPTVFGFVAPFEGNYGDTDEDEARLKTHTVTISALFPRYEEDPETSMMGSLADFDFELQPRNAAKIRATNILLDLVDGQVQIRLAADFVV